MNVGGDDMIEVIVCVKDMHLQLSNFYIHFKFNFQLILFVIFSDATVWKFESRFGFQFSSSRNRGFGFQRKDFFFGKLKSQTAVSVFRLFFDKVIPFLIPVNTEVLCAHARPSTLHTALFPLVLKTAKQLANKQTSYYVVVGTDMLLASYTKNVIKNK